MLYIIYSLYIQYLCASAYVCGDIMILQSFKTQAAIYSQIPSLSNPPYLILHCLNVGSYFNSISLLNWLRVFQHQETSSRLYKIKQTKSGEQSLTTLQNLGWSLSVFGRLYQGELHIAIGNWSSFLQQQLWEKCIPQTWWWSIRVLALEPEEIGSVPLLPLPAPPTKPLSTQRLTPPTHSCITLLLWFFKNHYGKIIQLLITVRFKISCFSLFLISILTL